MNCIFSPTNDNRYIMCIIQKANINMHTNLYALYVRLSSDLLTIYLCTYDSIFVFFFNFGGNAHIKIQQQYDFADFISVIKCQRIYS